VREVIEKDLKHIDLMLHYIGRISENIKRFSELNINLNDEMVIENLSFLLSQIGEQLANDKLSSVTKEKYPAVEWRKIKGLRNLVAHSYTSVNSSTILEIIQVNIPTLEDGLKDVRNDLIKQIQIAEDGLN